MQSYVITATILFSNNCLYVFPAFPRDSSQSNTLLSVSIAARVQNPCFVDGVTYKDGEQFQPDCARVCTCQNGFYGCVSKCPQESKRPSDDSCHNPRLLPVPGKCCKEWTCEKLDTAGEGGSILDGTRGLESDNLILQRPLFCKLFYWMKSVVCFVSVFLDEERCLFCKCFPG